MPPPGSPVRCSTLGQAGVLLARGHLWALSLATSHSAAH